MASAHNPRKNQLLAALAEESYQRLLNALLANVGRDKPLVPAYYTGEQADMDNPQDILLYVYVGDPALVPIPAKTTPAPPK